MEIKTVLLLRASMNAHVVRVTEQIDADFQKQGVKVLHLYGPYDIVHDPVLPDEHIDLVIAIGGDGTVLKAGRICSHRNVPILPVKVGHFGFINDIQYDEWKQALKMYRAGTLVYEEHMLLSVHVGEKVWYGLNDITVQSVVYGTIRTTVHCNGEFLTRYRSDGLIISTAVGSTAHSLSVGGPIICPGLNVVMLNPIAPFTLSHRPLIIPKEYGISIQLDENQRSAACLIADGRIIMGMREGSECHIKDAGTVAHILKSPKRSYFGVLREKLKWAGEL